jgi:eukaryotic-like serine/threonine-protein kinase
MWDKLRELWDGLLDVLHLPEVFSAIAEHIKEILIAAAVLVLALLVFYLVVTRGDSPSGAGFPEEPPADGGFHGTTTDADGHDSQGKEASFKIYVFSRDFAWVYQSDRDVEYQGTPEDIGPHLRSLGLQENFRDAKALIAVGAASQEGTEAIEKSRAQRRAERLQRWIKENVPGTQRLYTLSMGRFVGPAIKSATTAQTAPQRSIVIVAVVAEEENVIIAEALKSALIEEEAFPFKIEEYSAFDLRSWR